MSKVTARAHQPTIVSLLLSPAEVHLLTRLRRRWCEDQNQLEIVTRMVLDLGLQEWGHLRKTVLAAVHYINQEDLPHCRDLWARRVDGMTKRKFVA